MLLPLLTGLAAFAVFVSLEPSRVEPGDDVVEERLRAGLEEEATADLLAARISELLDEDRPEEAESWIELARMLGRTLPPDLVARYEDAMSPGAAALRSARNAARGFVTGEADDVAGLAGSVVSDFMVVGDARDIVREGRNLAAGREVDELSLGLSAVGLAMTTATVFTVGGAAPAKVGISVAKAARRAGKLTAGLEGALKAGVSAAVDMPGLKRLMARLDWSSPVKSAGEVKTWSAGVDVGRISAPIASLGTVAARTSPADAMRILRHVDRLDELAKAERVAGRFGKSTAAVFGTLGKGAFKAFSVIVTWTVQMILAFVAGVVSLLFAAAPLVMFLVRRAMRGLVRLVRFVQRPAAA